MSDVRVSQLLLERLISTNGLAVRKSMEDDAFWYTSGIPGPFYINTENIAGKNEAIEVLNNLNNILKANQSKEQQSKAILKTVNQVVNADKSYDASIDALLEFYLSQNSNEPSMISGGERRDWFFSIPIAKKLKIPHIFLYKNGEYHVTDHEGNSVELDLHNKKVLHVADIINQASSYSNRWIPILKNAGVEFSETLSVAVRSQEGIDKLRENNISVISPLIVDIPLFMEAYNLGLINEFAYNEIGLYYHSPESWTRQFIKGNSINYSLKSNIDNVKDGRIQSFKENDPYQLKNEFPWFFS
ncbi:phosphoribosyltransferase [Paenibacillus albiflavus]|uniref:Phosphoribosyltransferase n=1 Tax=Paenibacillus albiflavus TaxID=2545760 RepID=A0A4R4DWT4_9BACL|nr:phosphoribosyltransferase [Paenibacillus albiflavus]TCZ69023.1 phosphoribosyltransferase [Paenibacillus albiflavus]